LVLYTAYFDEADTHGPAPTIIMAGFLGLRAQWELFRRRLRRGTAQADPFRPLSRRAGNGSYCPTADTQRLSISFINSYSEMEMAPLVI
jgi:hypothetical protein